MRKGKEEILEKGVEIREKQREMATAARIKGEDMAKQVAERGGNAGGKVGAAVKGGVGEVGGLAKGGLGQLKGIAGGIPGVGGLFLEEGRSRVVADDGVGRPSGKKYGKFDMSRKCSARKPLEVWKRLWREKDLENAMPKNFPVQDHDEKYGVKALLEEKLGQAWEGRRRKPSFSFTEKHDHSKAAAAAPEDSSPKFPRSGFLFSNPDLLPPEEELPNFIYPGARVLYLPSQSQPEGAVIQPPPPNAKNPKPHKGIVMYYDDDKEQYMVKPDEPPKGALGGAPGAPGGIDIAALLAQGPEALEKAGELDASALMPPPEYVAADPDQTEPVLFPGRLAIAKNDKFQSKKIKLIDLYLEDGEWSAELLGSERRVRIPIDKVDPLPVKPFPEHPYQPFPAPRIWKAQNDEANRICVNPIHKCVLTTEKVGLDGEDVLTHMAKDALPWFRNGSWRTNDNMLNFLTHEQRVLQIAKGINNSLHDVHTKVEFAKSGAEGDYK